MKKWFAYIALGAVCLTAWRCSDKDYSDVTFNGVKGLFVAPGMSYTLPFSGGSGEYTVELLRYDSPDDFAVVSIAPFYGFAGWGLAVETEQGIEGAGTIVVTDTKSGKTAECFLSVNSENFTSGWEIEERQRLIHTFMRWEEINADLQSKSFSEGSTLFFSPNANHDCYGAGRWHLVRSNEMNVIVDTLATGTFISMPLDLKNLPGIYDFLPIEEQIHSAVRYVFEQEDGQHVYDLFHVYSPGTTSTLDRIMYEDRTAYYQAKYPDAKVTAVVNRYIQRYGH